MKINQEVRKFIWDKYCDLEFQIRDLKGIVQNDIELSDKDLEIHKRIWTIRKQNQDIALDLLKLLWDELWD